MAAMLRLEDEVQMPVLTGRNSKRRCRTYRNGNAPDAAGVGIKRWS